MQFVAGRCRFVGACDSVRVRAASDSRLSTTLATGALFGQIAVLAWEHLHGGIECWLGFVLGMMLTFGTVLPTVVGGVIAGLSALIHLGLVPAVARGWAAFTRN